jgi:inosine-uridine nucleoside N-ribohydrolase
MRQLLTALLVSASALLGFPIVSQAADTPEMVIVDNDFSGPGGSDLQSALFFLDNPKFNLLGLTVVTGDSWRDEETAHLLRFLEIAKHPEIPVVPGAVFPLINTPERMKIWESRFGKIPWKGAWNDPKPGQPTPSTDPFFVPPLKEGQPSIKAAAGNAAQFLIDQVHAHPHQISILAAGPMTDLALAVRLDPQFASLAKQLVFMGGLIDTNLGQVTGSADNNTDFNFVFDPEAAHIVLTAPWPSITCAGAVTNKVVMDKALIAKMTAKDTPLTQYLAQNAWTGLPLWDEAAAAVLADPLIVTKSVDALMDVDLSDSYNYGHAHVWPLAAGPGLGERPVRILLDLDANKLESLFLKAAQQDLAH